jgi:hypothetical protein
MVGRSFLTDEALARRGYMRPEMTRRREVLRETLDTFARVEPRDRFHRLADENLARWRSEAPRPSRTSLEVRVIPGDWGEVTAALTREHGDRFAVLNMANAFVPGGAYVEGTAAQEENMFRRTDCHFHVTDDLYDAATDRYRPHATALLSARDGRVFLDMRSPRVCLRGAEDLSREDLGYRWLPDDELFSFFELRAAAEDLRGGRTFDEREAARRIGAQLDTLRDAGVRHAVLSAFGCGAFHNPADRVAVLYRDALAARREHFTLIAFAIFAPGYGPDNHAPFAAVFAQATDASGTLVP